MGHIMLSYAAFAYYTAEKDFKIQRVSAGFISFWYEEEEGKTHPLELIADKPDSDCGYVVINTEKMDDIFKKDHALIRKLKSAERVPRIDPKGVLIYEHCKYVMPPADREKMIAKNYNDEEIRCRSIKSD
jgi:hypothetical protein